jgi:XTP/dITP diphosphohydrolase
VKTLIFATGNSGKVTELQALLGREFQVKYARDFPQIPEPIEDALTFEGNAEIKARAFALGAGQWAVADDSGLCVDFLGGGPGVLSARYAENPAACIDKLLLALRGVPEDQRTAKFVCVLCLVGPTGEGVFSRGECQGRISIERRGSLGFGYDSVFEPTEQGGLKRTMAELSLSEKSAISHRAIAFRNLRDALKNTSHEC